MDFNNNQKSFEELLREKVEHHEFPFEANGWAQMQSKLQAHQAQAAATQTTLYKSILLKTGKILVCVVSGSAIVYSTLSLTGMLDKKEIATNNSPKQEIVLQQDTDANKSAAGSATAGNTAMLNLADDKKAESIADANASNAKSLELDMAANHTIAANKLTAKAGSNIVKRSAATTDFSADSHMQNEKQNHNNDVTATNNSAKSNADLQTAKNTSKDNAVNNTDQNKIAVNDAKAEAEKSYIAVEKNASANINAATEKAAVVHEPVAKEETVIAKADEAKEEITAANAEVDSALALNNSNGGKYPQKPSVNKPASKFGLIVSGGLNANWSRNLENNTLEIMATPMVGLHATMPLSKNMLVQAGAQYASYDIKNVSHTSAVVQYAILQDSSVTRTSITQAKYLEFPLLLKYGVHPRFNIYTGLRTGLLIGAKASVTQEQYVNHRLTGQSAPQDGNKFAQYNGLRSVDFGLPVGIEGIISNRISVSATYTLGLTDFTIDRVFDNPNTPATNGQKDKHSLVQVQLNVRLF